MAEESAIEADGECVVLGQKEDTFAGLSWSGAEPDELSDPEEALEFRAIWEGDELVTYDLGALTRMAQQSEGEGWPEDND